MRKREQKPNPFRCPLPKPAPRDCAFCLYRDECPRSAALHTGDDKAHF